MALRKVAKAVTRLRRRATVKAVRTGQKLKTKASIGYQRVKTSVPKVGAHVKKHKKKYLAGAVAGGVGLAYTSGKRRGKRMRGRPRKRR